MNDTDKTNKSKRLSYFLRHRPDSIGVPIDSHGWVSVETLIEKLRIAKQEITAQELEEIVATCPKKRYEFNQDHTKIRASQGHSIEVDLGYEPKTPPEILYHGTAENTVEAILKDGLNKMRRHAVHLSKDKDTATTVGARHGKPHILTIATGQMHRDGFEFQLSTNGVWLTDHIPAKYIS